MRVLSGLLAIGGILWGLFCLLFFITGDALRSLVLFGPGYVVTIGYIVRFCTNPPLSARRTIWGLSCLVQGAWLGWYLWGAAHGGARASTLEFLGVAWWSLAFGSSVLGLAADSGIDGSGSDAQESCGTAPDSGGPR